MSRVKAGKIKRPPGRPRKSVRVVDITRDDPMDFLSAIMTDTNVDIDLRMRAADKILAHRKGGKIGKKQEKQDSAEAAASGKFRPTPAPKLVVNNR